jgi:nitrogen fixation/metabolism regulation signal transduction histidine kinase
VALERETILVMGVTPRAALERWLAAWQRSNLGAFLGLINVAIVLLAAGGVAATAIGLLEEQADQQARAQIAGASVREDVRRLGEDTLTTARVLGSRPTLQRLVEQQRRAAIEPFLKRFCETSGIDACALVQGDALVATAGTPIPWRDVVAAGIEQGERFLTEVGGSTAPLLGASAPLADHAGLRVIVVRLLDQRLADTLGQRLVQLPATEIDTAVGRLAGRLVWVSLLVVALALLAGWVLGQRVARPVRELTEAASRLGRGDFSTSIPPGGPAEVGMLARTMEGMRRSLLDLTDSLRRTEADRRAVLEGIVEGVYAVDEERRIRYVNPRAEQLLGVRAEQAIGRFCGDVLKPSVNERGQRPCELDCPILAARRELRGERVERLQLAADQRRTVVISSAGPAEGLQVQVIRDETELEAARRARDTVLANCERASIRCRRPSGASSCARSNAAR